MDGHYAGTVDGMRTTIDGAGRIVIPKALRECIGLAPGEVELTSDGTAVRVAPILKETVIEVDGLLVVPDGPPMTDADVRALRLADQR